MCSGSTRGPVLNGELHTQRLQNVNLCTFIYRLFHEDFSSIIGTNTGANSQALTCFALYTDIWLNETTIQHYAPRDQLNEQLELDIDGVAHYSC